MMIHPLCYQFQNLTIVHLISIGNLVLEPSCNALILSILSNSPKSQDAKLSVNISVTVKSNSLTLL